MMKLKCFLLLLAVSSVAKGENECYLCDDTCAVLNEETLVEIDDGSVLTCAQLSMTLFDTADADQCIAAQQSYSLSCCADNKEPFAELFLPDDFEFVDEDTVEESLASRVTRMLWSTFKPSTSWGSGSTKSSYSKPTSSYKTSSGSSSSSSSSKCSLCRDRSRPKKETQGVVVGHYSLSYTGTCVGLDSKLKTLAANHQMCKVCQAQFVNTCGCGADYQQKASDKSSYMGSWGW